MKKTIIRECVRLSIELYKKNYEEYWGSKFRHFSFIVVSNKIIEYGMNRHRNLGDMQMAGYRGYSNEHSEFAAWRKAKGLVKDNSFEIVNTRLNKELEIMNSHPCQCCMNFLKDLNCSGIFYSNEVGGFSKIVL